MIVRDFGEVSKHLKLTTDLADYADFADFFFEGDAVILVGWVKSRTGTTDLADYADFFLKEMRSFWLGG